MVRPQESSRAVGALGAVPGMLREPGDTEEGPRQQPVPRPGGRRGEGTGETPWGEGAAGQVHLVAPHVPDRQGEVSGPSSSGETSSHFPGTGHLCGQEERCVPAKETGSEQAAGGAGVWAPHSALQPCHQLLGSRPVWGWILALFFLPPQATPPWGPVWSPSSHHRQLLALSQPHLSCLGHP